MSATYPGSPSGREPVSLLRFRKSIGNEMPPLDGAEIHPLEASTKA